MLRSNEQTLSVHKVLACNGILQAMFMALSDCHGGLDLAKAFLLFKYLHEIWRKHFYQNYMLFFPFPSVVLSDMQQKTMAMNRC